MKFSSCKTTWKNGQKKRKRKTTVQAKHKSEGRTNRLKGEERKKAGCHKCREYILTDERMTKLREMFNPHTITTPEEKESRKNKSEVRENLNS